MPQSLVCVDSPASAPSEERTGRGFGCACFVKRNRRLDPSAARASRAAGRRCRGGLLWLTFLGRSRKVSAAAHSRQCPLIECCRQRKSTKHGGVMPSAITSYGAKWLTTAATQTALTIANCCLVFSQNVILNKATHLLIQGNNLCLTTITIKKQKNESG